MRSSNLIIVFEIGKSHKSRSWHYVQAAQEGLSALFLSSLLERPGLKALNKPWTLVLPAVTDVASVEKSVYAIELDIEERVNEIVEETAGTDVLQLKRKTGSSTAGPRQVDRPFIA
jgi:hypothetical protein